MSRGLAESDLVAEMFKLRRQALGTPSAIGLGEVLRPEVAV